MSSSRPLVICIYFPNRKGIRNGYLVLQDHCSPDLQKKKQAPRFEDHKRSRVEVKLASVEEHSSSDEFFFHECYDVCRTLAGCTKAVIIEAGATVEGWCRRMSCGLRTHLPRPQCHPELELVRRRLRIQLTKSGLSHPETKANPY